MDLVDIDKVLDLLELESAPVEKAPSRTPTDTNRRIKVRSVLSSLNDYVEYDDRKQQLTEKSGNVCKMQPKPPTHSLYLPLQTPPVAQTLIQTHNNRANCVLRVNKQLDAM